MRAVSLLLVVLPLGCRTADAHHEASASASVVTAPVAVSAAPPLPSASAPAADPPYSGYAWPDATAAVDSLRTRVAPPKGFTRVPVAPRSFGAFLRDLPLAPPHTPVKSYRGDVIREADHPNIEAVVAIDIGAADLQQCADSVVRLHAEWRWSEGVRAHMYRAASPLEMPLDRFVKGERVVAHGPQLSWEQKAKARPLDHALFREYLDTVFAWANTGSIARDAKPTSVDGIAAGDFFVLPGAPGHAVLVLDLATHADGRKVALLGQGFMPAQSFQVLRPAPGAWYEIDPAQPGVKTPFWPTFPWSSLRRMDPG